jgi:hypothetical protein
MCQVYNRHTISHNITYTIYLLRCREPFGPPVASQYGLSPIMFPGAL